MCWKTREEIARVLINLSYFRHLTSCKNHKPWQSNLLALISWVRFKQTHILEHFLFIVHAVFIFFCVVNILSLNAENLYASTIRGFVSLRRRRTRKNFKLAINIRSAKPQKHIYTHILSCIQQINHPLSIINLYFLPHPQFTALWKLRSTF